MVKEEKRRLVEFDREGPRASGFHAESATAFALDGEDNSFDFAVFAKTAKFSELESGSADKLSFVLSGVEAPVANALRRAMISEVETAAFDKIHLYQNTGIMADEVFCHRLGLVPLWVPDVAAVPAAPEELGSVDWDINKALKFKLHVKCGPGEGTKAVYSRDIVFCGEADADEQTRAPQVVLPDILLTKLRPGQEVEAELYALRGSGQLHAKWSPVCTASYRLRPEIALKQPLFGSLARHLQQVCPMGVFDVEDSGAAVVKNPDACTTCRLCIEDDLVGEHVLLAKRRSEYLFTVETTGALEPADVVFRALEILRLKALTAKQRLSRSTGASGSTSSPSL